MTYELEISLAIIVALSGIVGIWLKKRPSTIPPSTERSIEQRTTAINDIKHLQEDIKDLKKDIGDLYALDTQKHAEVDRIMGKIHALELKFAEFIGGKKQ